MIKRDYTKPVIPTQVVIELIGLPDTKTTRTNFHHFVDNNQIERTKGRGRAQSLFSINSVRQIAILKKKEIFIPEEYMKMCEVEAEPVLQKVEKTPPSSDDWAKKADMLAWLTGKTVDEILNECLDSYKRYVARVVNDADIK